MALDVTTMFAVTIAVTALLGLLLIYVWQQDRKRPALLWWGGAHVVASWGVGLISLQGLVSPALGVEVGNALLLLSAGMVWTAVRLFDGNSPSVVGLVGGLAVWFLAIYGTEMSATPGAAEIFGSTLVAAYALAAAMEFWRNRGQNLVSRSPMVVLLTMHGGFYVVRVPLALLMPGANTEILFSPAWFGVIGLESLLYMIATSFIFLAMVKERLEQEQKVAAMTDPLTGVPNRRAFLEASINSLRQRGRVPQPVSALLFDLDRFKSINDRYGHAAGDRVLRVFADIAATELRSTDVLGRLGGEEFGAVLFGAESGAAAATAERIRANLAASFSTDGDTAVSVSVGVVSVAADEAVDIETLMGRADEALYVAKARGRNRVEVANSYASKPRVGSLPLEQGALATQGLMAVPAPEIVPEGLEQPASSERAG